MCGIAGFIRLSQSPTINREEPIVERMLNALHHRGPDDGGAWSSPDHLVTLGHRRLSILDLSTNAHQPMIGTSGSVLIYNGELYNFETLRKRFRPESLCSTSDTEVLLRCFEADGEECLEYLNGMFAFAVWDPGARKLLLARDRIGIKPLYYTTMGGVFAFASEIKALLTLPWVEAQLDEEALASFLSFNHLQPPETMFKGIAKFHPGHQMVVDSSGIREYTPFWKPAWNRVAAGSDTELSTLVLHELEESVRRQMMSDVPVGAFLSGGVDSSGIVALACQNTDRPLTTYSIGFDASPDYNELYYARQVARKFKTNHIERVVKKEELAEFLPKLVDIYDEPLADATSVPIYFISQLARANGTKVVLTGDGADELFCGYRRWATQARVLPWYRAYLRCPSWLRKSARLAYGMFERSSPRYELLRQAAAGNEVYWGAGGFKEDARRDALSPEYALRLSNHDPYRRVQCARAAFRSALPNPAMQSDVNWLCYNGLIDAVPNFYCRRADSIGMAHSVELRVPFLDNEIVDLAFSLPWKSKLKRGIPKYILKKALEPLLPHEVLYRPKMGFCVPIREWANDILVPYIDQHLQSFCHETGLFREEGLRQQLRQARAGDPSFSFGLWNLYFLMAWMRKWVLGRSE